MYQINSTDISIINVQETAKLHSTNCVNFFLILIFSALKVDLCFAKKIEILIFYHLIFNKEEIWSKAI